MKITAGTFPQSWNEILDKDHSFLCITWTAWHTYRLGSSALYLSGALFFRVELLIFCWLHGLIEIGAKIAGEHCQWKRKYMKELLLHNQLSVPGIDSKEHKRIQIQEGSGPQKWLTDWLKGLKIPQDKSKTERKTKAPVKSAGLVI